MKLSMKTVMLGFGLAVGSGTSLADGLVVECHVGYQLPDGQEKDFIFNSRPVQGATYVTVDEQLPLLTGSASLYVYYDGKYAAINLFHEGTDTYFNSDSEVAVGKLFTLVSRSPDSHVATKLSVACHSR